MENVSLWIGNMHRPHPFYRTFDTSLAIHVTAEPYAYSYIATCTLLYVAKIIQQAWLHRKHVTVKIKQKNLETNVSRITRTLLAKGVSITTSSGSPLQCGQFAGSSLESSFNLLAVYMVR